MIVVGCHSVFANVVETTYLVAILVRAAGCLHDSVQAHERCDRENAHAFGPRVRRHPLRRSSRLRTRPLEMDTAIEKSRATGKTVPCGDEFGLDDPIRGKRLRGGEPGQFPRRPSRYASPRLVLGSGSADRRVRLVRPRVDPRIDQHHAGSRRHEHFASGTGGARATRLPRAELLVLATRSVVGRRPSTDRSGASLPAVPIGHAGPAVPGSHCRYERRGLRGIASCALSPRHTSDKRGRMPRLRRPVSDCARKDDRPRLSGVDSH